MARESCSSWSLCVCLWGWERAAEFGGARKTLVTAMLLTLTYVFCSCGLQRKRAERAFKVANAVASREEAKLYHDLVAKRKKEAKKLREEQASKRRSQNSANKSGESAPTKSATAAPAAAAKAPASKAPAAGAKVTKK